MQASPLTPSIAVTIGRQTRLYNAFVTTAPAAVDTPSTVTLYAPTRADVSGLAADDIRFDRYRARTGARLVLVDATELSWQRRRDGENKHA